jgi:hypothetical protein
MSPLKDDLCECGDRRSSHGSLVLIKSSNTTRKVAKGTGMCQYSSRCGCERFKLGRSAKTTIPRGPRREYASPPLYPVDK